MTNGQYFRATAERRGIPERTLPQVRAALRAAKTAQDRVAFARLMARHGRLTADARRLVERIAR